MSEPQLNYSLSTLFSGERKIVVPDMQREYCWASTKAEYNGLDLVTNFMNSLLQKENRGSLTRLGLIYGYENPRNYLQLCDGQQRITTLYLLCGVLYKKLEDNSSAKPILRDILISDSEINDDHEPRLQYAVRESTLFFLRDLVWCYFLEQEGKIAEGSANIKAQNWYFSEYDLDPTIIDILKAVDIISGKLEEETSQGIGELSFYIAILVQFFLFDMQDRKHGEEQFVVLNTTGKELTATENWKPVFVGRSQEAQTGNYADMWEKWEQFFWENKHPDLLTADSGLNEFFRWIFMLEDSGKVKPNSQESEKLTDAQNALQGRFFNMQKLGEYPAYMDVINSYLTTLDRLRNNKEISEKFMFRSSALSQADCFVFLPVLLFAHLFPAIDVNSRKMERVIRFFSNRIKDDNVSKTSILSVFNGVDIIRTLAAAQIPDIAKSIEFECSKTILSEEEIFKFNIYLKESDRKNAENLIWRIENFKSCNGSLDFVFRALKWDITADCSQFDFARLNKIAEVIFQTFEQPDDVFRRALLAAVDYCPWVGSTPVLGANKYSLCATADSFGREARDKTHGEGVCSFINKLCSGSDIKTELNMLIESYQLPAEQNTWETARYQIIKNSEWLNFMEQKQFCISYDEQKIFALRQKNVTSDNSYREIV